MANQRIGVLEGDFIGPEIMKEALRILRVMEERSPFAFEIVPLEAGGQAYDKYGCHLPADTLRKAETCDALLKGPFGGPPEALASPKWSGVEQGAILPLRKHFRLYTNLRETKLFDSLLYLSPVTEHLIKDVDLLIVRELTSGMYFGEKQERVVNGERVYSDAEAYSESEIRRIAVRAFEYAKTRKNKVTLVAKSNVLKSSVLWREVVAETAASYPEVENDYMHVDNAAMQLILNPRQFDVILTSNMFGDILSDEASVLSGSIGLFPSASLGDGPFGLYEPIHGSAPSIAGRDIANPISAILCVALMLRYTFGEEAEAARIEHAVQQTLELGYRTQDLFCGGTDDPDKLLGTQQMGETIAAVLRERLS
ncbi:3-isopropylmalate dehydrogenase [Paenibacillus allorhizosphaerae]|uniref:3-isopropylmalate dehydrogenase n=1 Tax=Paenibacillus allorhizosphaerae TaxID=2849866 RepID=A0ABN7TVJ6_9BACL|nr:3-isopropylmalate dehydrogenase [Paenibacillus allorhizosphaerae]CAG7653905.1 3-isopropylmalate dehydrogenase [Paenibacillus allorhizosphaerae]